MKEKPVLICLLGPTAVGKTAMSLELAKRFEAEIISSDSRQMYRNIGIGTAQPTPQELAAIPHHFVDFLELEERYSAGQFEKDALQLISNSDEQYWILVGGSGLYTKALIDGLNELPHDLSVRSELNERLIDEGLDSLVTELRRLDPVQCSSMDTRNPQRVMRALEVCMISGRPYSELKNAPPEKRPFISIQIALRREKSALDKRIRQRCNQMMKEGWLEEARDVYHMRHLNSLNTVGYKSLFKLIEGELNEEEAIQNICTETSRFAKRQMTWLRSQKDIHWIDLPSDSALENIIRLVNSAVERH